MHGPLLLKHLLSGSGAYPRWIQALPSTVAENHHFQLGMEASRQFNLPPSRRMRACGSLRLRSSLLTGPDWHCSCRAADSLEFEKITDEKGVSHIMKCLEEQFKPHLELSLPRAFERAIYGQPRSHKEGIQEYIIRCERNFFLLEKEGVKLPDEAVGYVMFRQAALTESQELRLEKWEIR